jgi:hypothetical protein
MTDIIINDTNIAAATQAITDQAQAKAIEINVALQKKRLILNSDQMASLVSPRARHEQSFDALMAHFFTIDGVLNNKKIEGAMFAGECMLVFAPTLAKAQEQANAGLRATVELLHEEFDTRNTRALIDAEASPMAAGLEVGADGRRARKDDRPSTITPKHRAIMEHVIGGLPWKW